MKPRADMSQTPLNIIRGLPDDLNVRIASVEAVNGAEGVPDTRVTLNYTGSACFLKEVGRERKWHIVWLGPAAPAFSQLVAGPAVNYIADPDVCGKALAAAEQAAASLNRRWFNHPAMVRRSTRELVSATLGGVPGVEMPATIRLRRATLEQIFAAGDRLGYPVLVRLTGTHQGSAVVKVTRRDETEQLSRLGLPGADVYVTKFREYVSPDGLYRKYRAAVIGGVPLLRHQIIASNWLVNVGSRLWTDDANREEIATMADPGTVLTPPVRAAIAEVAARLRLDYFGIDFGFMPDGTVLIFEANASMDFLTNSHPSERRWDASLAGIRAALLALLDTPSRWAVQSRAIVAT